MSLSRCAEHAFSKPVRAQLTLLEGLGVEGDAHCGATVKHRSRVAKDPSQPNLRQVHLVAAERLDELQAQGFMLAPGDIGENVLTRGLDLFALPRGTRLHIGAHAVVEITGLRNPCWQLDNFQEGLTRACLPKDGDGRVQLRAGIMSVVMTGGDIAIGDDIRAVLPPPPHEALARV